MKERENMMRAIEIITFSQQNDMIKYKVRQKCERKNEEKKSVQSIKYIYRLRRMS